MAHVQAKYSHAQGERKGGALRKSTVIDDVAVAWVSQPIVRIQELEIQSRMVHRCSNRHGKQVLPISACAPRCAREFYKGVVLTLELVLMVRNELQIADVIENNPIVNSMPKLAHAIREMRKRTDLQSRGQRKRLFAHSVLPAREGPRTTKMG